MELLAKLTQAYGASGNESVVRDIIISEIKKYCDDYEVDAMGNLIAHKKGNGVKVMFAAHMDEIGIIVTHIDKNGYLRFSKVGGLYIRDLVHRRVRFSNGVVGVIGSEEDEFNKKPDIRRLYIDIGADTRDEASKSVSIGDTAVFCGKTVESGKRHN